MLELVILTLGTRAQAISSSLSTPLYAMKKIIMTKLRGGEASIMVAKTLVSVTLNSKFNHLYHHNPKLAVL